MWKDHDFKDLDRAVDGLVDLLIGRKAVDWSARPAGRSGPESRRGAHPDRKLSKQRSSRRAEPIS
jgi:hypothetical protein